MGAGDVLGKLLDLHPIHRTHGNAVINHTLCVLMVDISIPQKPRFLPLFWSSLMSGANINRDSNVSSVKTDIWYKRSFLSIAGAKVQQF